MGRDDVENYRKKSFFFFFFLRKVKWGMEYLRIKRGGEIGDI